VPARWEGCGDGASGPASDDGTDKEEAV
jgi:hypothetical protein